MLIRLPGHEIFDESMCAQSVSLDDLNLSFIFSCDAIFYVDGIHLKVHHSSEKLRSINAVGSSDCQKSKPICWATLSIIHCRDHDFQKESIKSGVCTPQLDWTTETFFLCNRTPKVHPNSTLLFVTAVSAHERINLSRNAATS